MCSAATAICLLRRRGFEMKSTCCLGKSRRAAPGDEVNSLSPKGRGSRAKRRCSRKGACGLGAALRGRRQGGEPGLKRSCGPFLPGERPGLWPGAACTGQGVWPRAQRASSSDSPRLFEQSERSERSEFRGGPRDRTRRAVVAPRRPPRRSDAPSPNAPLPPPRSRASSHPSKRKRETPDHGPHRPRPRPRLQGEPATR